MSRRWTTEDELYIFKENIEVKRNELEITSLNDMYLQEEKLKACLLGEGYTWFDTGTEESMADATAMIRSIQNNKDKVICCPEAIAYCQGWLSDTELEKSAELMKKNKYGKYLKKVLEKGRKN